MNQMHPLKLNLMTDFAEIHKDLHTSNQNVIPIPKNITLPKLTIVLDLDETLIHSRFPFRRRKKPKYYPVSLPELLQNQDPDYCFNLGQPGYQKVPFSKQDHPTIYFDNNNTKSSSDGHHPQKENIVYTWRRDYLDFLLKTLSSFANIIIWTAGTQGYALPIIRELNHTNSIKGSLFRHHTTRYSASLKNEYSKKINTQQISRDQQPSVSKIPFGSPFGVHSPKIYSHQHPSTFLSTKSTHHHPPTPIPKNKIHIKKIYAKDLTKLKTPMTRTIIVDNNPWQFFLYPSNGISITSFYGKQDNLLGLLSTILQALVYSPDVRWVIDWYTGKYSFNESDPHLPVDFSQYTFTKLNQNSRYTGRTTDKLVPHSSNSSSNSPSSTDSYSQNIRLLDNPDDMENKMGFKNRRARL